MESRTRAQLVDRLRFSAVKIRSSTRADRLTRRTRNAERVDLLC